MLVAVVGASAKTISLLLTKPWAKTPNNIVTKNKPPASLALNCGDDFSVCSLITLVLICFSLYVSARLDDALAISLAPHAIVKSSLFIWSAEAACLANELAAFRAGCKSMPRCDDLRPLL